MSSTNRGANRDPLDEYPTPRWCVHRLLERVELPGGFWCEPCAGAGSIIRAVGAVRSDVLWVCNELNPKYEPVLKALPAVIQVATEDARELAIGPGAAVVITNPPFVTSLEILEQVLRSAPGAVPVFLQRIGWGGGPRAARFRELKPSVYQLPQRPSFKDVITVDPETGKLKKSSQDSTEYCWWVFDGQGRFEILGDTPDEVRAAEKAERRAAEIAEGLVWADGPNKGMPIERCPDGTINNCSRANGVEMVSCQMCGGCCPDIPL